MITLALRNIFRNLRRSLLCAFAIAVSAMAIVLLLGLIDGMETDMRENLVAYYTGEIRVRNSEFDHYERYNPLHLNLEEKATSKLIESIAEVEAVSGRINFGTSIYQDERMSPVLGLGLDFESEGAFSNLQATLTEGRLPKKGANEVLLGEMLATNLSIGVGERITLLGPTAAGSSNASSYTVSGIVSPPIGSLSSSTLYMDLERAQHFLLMDGRVQELIVRTTGTQPLNVVAEKIGQQITAELGVPIDARAFDELNEMYGFLRTAKLIYYIIALFFFILGSTVIINTTMMIIYERMAEIGMMKALGMYDGQVRLLFLLEGAFISAAGALFGVLAGLAISAVLAKVGIDFTEAMSGIDMEISSILYPSVSVLTAVGVFFYGVIIATLSTLIPTRRAAKIQIVEALYHV